MTDTDIRTALREYVDSGPAVRPLPDSLPLRRQRARRQRAQRLPAWRPVAVAASLIALGTGTVVGVSIASRRPAAPAELLAPPPATTAPPVAQPTDSAAAGDVAADREPVDAAVAAMEDAQAKSATPGVNPQLAALATAYGRPTFRGDLVAADGPRAVVEITGDYGGNPANAAKSVWFAVLDHESAWTVSLLVPDQSALDLTPSPTSPQPAAPGQALALPPRPTTSAAPDTPQGLSHAVRELAASLRCGSLRVTADSDSAGGALATVTSDACADAASDGQRIDLILRRDGDRWEVLTSYDEQRPMALTL